MRHGGRWLLAAAVAAGFLGGLAACETSLQKSRVATCRRALPAVADPGALRLLRAAPGPGRGTVRVDYAEGDRRHVLVCRFDSGAAVTALTRDGTALTDASLYMLRRFYLDTPDAAADDPGAR